MFVLSFKNPFAQQLSVCRISASLREKLPQGYLTTERSKHSRLYTEITKLRHYQTIVRVAVEMSVPSLCKPAQKAQLLCPGSPPRFLDHQNLQARCALLVVQSVARSRASTT